MPAWSIEVMSGDDTDLSELGHHRRVLEPDYKGATELRDACAKPE
jgi:hypothetical protein